MKISKVLLIIFITLTFLLIPFVSAEDALGNETVTAGDDNLLEESANAIYVDDLEGNDLNDGLSEDTSVKTFARALDVSDSNGTIYMSSGSYESDSNTRIIIDKSVNIVGSDDTTFNGRNADYLFTVTGNVHVTFKNIKFINFYKDCENSESAYGSVLDIKDSHVTLENCSFINNLVNHNSRSAVYGGAISNFGHLTIINSYFSNNTANSAQGLYSAGGAIYNRGKLFIRNSTLSNSKSGVFSYGAGIANYGQAEIDRSAITGSSISSESKGSAIYNAGNLILTNSVIENNTAGRTGINQIYGSVYNVGNFTGFGNIFRSNFASTDSSSVVYKGSGNVYNLGNLNLTYNVFINNSQAQGLASDVYYDGGKIISLDNNWWDTNSNPYTVSKFNLNDEINSWLKFTLTPTYSRLNISDSIMITAKWDSDGDISKIDLLPVLNATFRTLTISKTESLTDGRAEFEFTYSQNRGLYMVTADVWGFRQSVEVDVGKLNSNLDYNLTDSIEYLDMFKINVSVAKNGITPTGNVTVKLNAEEYVINLTDACGSLEIENLNPGTYAVEIIYNGDGNYFKSFENATLTVEKQPVNMTLEIPSIKIDEKSTRAVVNLLTKGAQGQAVLYLNGVRKQNVYLYNGETSITLRNLAEGQYNATIAFLGNDKYGALNVSAQFKVSKYSTVLNIYANDINAGENQTIIIEALPEDLRGEAILSINGVNSTIWINSTNTTVTVSNLGYGSYDVEVIYQGDSRYYGANDTVSFRVLRQPSQLTADITENENDLNATVKVKINPLNCTGLIGVYINYHFYSMNLTGGEATFEVELDPGTNYVFIYYEGDETYESSNWNTTLTCRDNFVFIGENSTAFEYNDFNYSIRLLELSGIAIPNANVTVNLNNKIYYIITDEDGYGYLPLNLKSGQYHISASYLNKTVNNTLTVKEILFELEVNDTVYGKSEKIIISCDDDLKGQFNVFIRDILDVNLTITNGTAEYDLSGLDAGNYAVFVKYFNDYYNSSQKSGEFKVSKADLNAEVSFTQKEFTITLLNLENATGNITFTIKNGTYSASIENSSASIVKRLDEGNHTLIASYGGDKNYNPFNLTAGIFVKSFKTDVIISVNGTSYGKDIIAVVNVDKKATGIIRFALANVTKESEIQNGAAKGIFAGIDAGNYTLKVQYLGDEFYLENENSTSVAIKKADSNLTLYVLEAALDENIRIHANLTENATGSVLFSMDGYYSPRYKNIVDSKSSWYISPLDTGVYKVTASYAGDKNFNPSNTTYMLNISQKKAYLEVSIEDVRVVDRVSAKIKLTNKSGSPIAGIVRLTIAQRTYDVDVDNGEATLLIGRMQANNYTYSASYGGNDEYAKTSLKGSFEVRDSLLNLIITAKNLTKYYKGPQKLSVTVKTAANKTVSGVEVFVEINGKTYSLTTDGNGKAEMDINLNPKNYTAFIYVKEDDYYHNASANVSVNVLSTVEAIDLIKLYSTSGQYFAIFSDSNGRVLSNTEVTFRIGSNSYTAKTLPNGIVRLNINLNPGKYTITAVNPVTSQKAVNSIFIFLRLMENGDVNKYYLGSEVYKVRAYGDDGKAVGAGEIVQIKVNGKKYSVKTDKKGYAKLAINLNPGKYTIKATYKGYTVTDKVNVKTTVVTKNIAVKKSRTIKFQAKILNSKGKILKNKKVTFKFKGKTYTAKTNKKGIATVSIKNKYKVGKYKIKTTYGKLTRTNTITVKK